MTGQRLAIDVPKRVLGAYDAGRPGPLVIALGGIHGNEPAGVEAIRRLCAVFDRERPAFAGRFVGLAGNLTALRARRRFVARDLNRGWHAKDLEALGSRDRPDDVVEDREQRDLIAQFDELLGAAHGPVFFLDCHSSSADGAPFLCCTETTEALHLAMALGVPALLGIGKTIAGAVLEYFDARGVVGLAVEGGRHEDPATVDVLEACLWCLLEDIGALPDVHGLQLDRHRSTVRRVTAGLPHAIDIFQRHVVQSPGVFAMQPGFRSFDEVVAGQLLAHDDGAEIRAPEDCRVLLPLYQGQGEDGFFLGRDVPPHALSPNGIVDGESKHGS